MLDPHIRDPLKKKNSLDIGANPGNYALVLPQHAKDVYSIEPSAANYAIMNRILAENPNLSENVRSFDMGVTDRESETSGIRSGEAAKISSRPGEHIKLMTIDAFVKLDNIPIGFIKADVEGHSLAVVKGRADSCPGSFNIFFRIRS
jgi:FkbM family methyltransferase